MYNPGINQWLQLPQTTPCSAKIFCFQIACKWLLSPRSSAWLLGLSGFKKLREEKVTFKCFVDDFRNERLDVARLIEQSGD